MSQVLGINDSDGDLDSLVGHGEDKKTVWSKP